MIARPVGIEETHDTTNVKSGVRLPHRMPTNAYLQLVCHNDGMKKCKKCSLEKELTEFYARSAMCKSCHSEYTKQHYKDKKSYYKEKAKLSREKIMSANKMLVRGFLMENPCIDCGCPDIEVLQFDHRDEKTKEYTIANIYHLSQDKLLKEMAKCDVRCANCHTKRTRRQFGHWRVGKLDVDFILGSSVLVTEEYIEKMKTWEARFK